MQKLLTALSSSSSDFCSQLAGSMSTMLIMSAIKVVLKARPSPLVTPPSELLIATRSVAEFTASEKLPTATLIPITVPMKPRIGTAHMNTLTIE